MTSRHRGRAKPYLRESDEALELAHGDGHRPPVPGLVSHRQVQLLQHPRRLQGQGRVAVGLGVGNVPLQELRENKKEEGKRTSVGDEEGGRQRGGTKEARERGRRGRRPLSRGRVSLLRTQKSFPRLPTESRWVVGRSAKACQDVLRFFRICRTSVTKQRRALHYYDEAGCSHAQRDNSKRKNRGTVAPEPSTSTATTTEPTTHLGWDWVVLVRRRRPPQPLRQRPPLTLPKPCHTPASTTATATATAFPTAEQWSSRRCLSKVVSTSTAAPAGQNTKRSPVCV